MPAAVHPTPLGKILLLVVLSVPQGPQLLPILPHFGAPRAALLQLILDGDHRPFCAPPVPGLPPGPAQHWAPSVAWGEQPLRTLVNEQVGVRSMSFHSDASASGASLSQRRQGTSPEGRRPVAQHPPS